MRYFEIVSENLAGDRVRAATQQKADAQHRYQDAMRDISQNTPAPKVGAKQATARAKLQSSMQKADGAIRSASKLGTGPGA